MRHKNLAVRVGSIVERKPTTTLRPPKPFSSGKTGFPTVEHRSKSAFARNREGLRRNGTSKHQEVPLVEPSAKLASPPPLPDSDDWREQISRENEQRVAHMTEEEQEGERKEILERFGANVGDLLKRARLAREKQGGLKDRVQPLPMDVRQLSEGSPPPSALVTPGNSRPSSRLDRRLRFAELEPDDVHVYDNVPASPEKRRALALPAPDPQNRAVSLGSWQGKISGSPLAPPNAQSMQEEQEPEEGSAEYIRQRFFPFTPKDPNLEWMTVDSDAPPSDSSSALRFDLRGNPISSSLSLKLPTHLGLHHHSEGAHAGYTLDDIFLLSRSTVPAQRSMMLNILAGVARRLGKAKKGEAYGMEELVGKEETLRKRILAAGVEAMSDKGSIGPLAIEVVWECIVGWEPELMNVDGAELASPAESAIDTIPFEFFLPQVATLMRQGGTPPESASQLLSVLHRLAQQSNAIADKIVSTSQLLPIVLQVFLLTPIPSQDSSPMPNPLALRLFSTLAQSSRSNAREIEKLSDSLLRFVTFSPFSSPYPPSLAVNLVVGTLQVYRALAAYGLYSHIAGTAQEQFAEVERYVISEACHSEALVIAWTNLAEAWTICAVDPHQTTPPHDILWTQITGWAWYESIGELQSHLDVRQKDWAQWSATWRLQAAWLEGCKINGVKGGEAERADFVEIAKSGFENGVELRVVVAVLQALQTGLDEYSVDDIEELATLASYADVLSSVIRLWLACVAPHTEGPPASPPFPLAYAQISAMARKLLVHPLWSSPASPDVGLFCLYRKLSGFLSYYLRFSRRLPDISQSLWVAQAFSILSRLVPGDEIIAHDIVKDVVALVTCDWATARDIKVPSEIWASGGLGILQPFLLNIVQPHTDVCISPLTMTPQSIKASTTERLPASVVLREFGLPLRKDWTLAPLDHLLRSGDSAVFKALSISWDSSETEVVRASFLLSKVAQATLLKFSMLDFVMTREAAVFGCMKVFMLEHGQPQNDSTEEVFRDEIACRLMEDILCPYEWGTIGALPTPQDDLEKAAVRFLGPSVPFFQFYTDFVGLYDAISFAHPLFARLLLPPISMRYALDYRKHLWSDFNHVVRTICVSPGNILSLDIREYLYPLETDKQIIASYLSSLLKDSVRNFMRLVAIHHIASNIWPDLQEVAHRNEERESALLKAIVAQGGIELVRQIITYRQTSAGNVLVSPVCYEGLPSEARTIRLGCISRWGGQIMLILLATW
ncbi:hypothetical protein HYPSUDRAFT_70687 [Hypholoma sublateritium FD-334 SS-4]|uniref:RNA polymerase II-associated protein 1 C-terminal domain-containing protein n=1 Tax=Hypholoma sublateritium (strain FD-334 SS-4) TaxID=945553 RepID=A0A0D2KRZ5_HYPSF|nr:hypothetical protein HYPSUDRAFT_70687 [Hypholoma sublateritium FD-334 SS-4]